MTRADQELLAEYALGRASAFAELVERHGGLVYAVAWRVTGDTSAAEEVAQDVFCVLARRAAQLASHPNVAGWLHRTALHTGQAVRRRHRRHERKLARFAGESIAAKGGVAVEAESWHHVDEAIDRLPADERAVVLLRFFHDLDYTQIGARLGVSVEAARKRLSRALRRLQHHFGVHRVESLTSGCLAIALPTDLAQAIAAAAPTASAGGLASIVLMTQKQALTSAAAFILSGGLAWFGADQWQDNKLLKAKIAHLEALALDASSASGAVAVPIPSPADPGTSEPADAEAEVATLRVELATERAARTAAEKTIGELRAQTAGLSEEVVVSFGKVTEIGSTIGSLFTEALALQEVEKAGELDTPEGQKKMAAFFERAISVTGLSKEIVGFEDKPEEGSQYAAAIYATAFDLDEAARAKVVDYFSEELATAAEKELTLSHLPPHGTPEFEPWLQKRWDFFNERRDRLRDLIPEEKRASFDAWVEKGGYGFKNLTIKGAPLMFSMGGDPR